MIPENDPIKRQDGAPNSPSSAERLQPGNEFSDYEEEEENSINISAGSGSKPTNWIRLVLLLLFLPLFFLIPTLYRSLKNWRSNILVEKSAAAFAFGDQEHGITLIKQAVALSPGSRSVRDAVELFNARSGDRTALDNLLLRMANEKLSPDTLLGITELEAKHAHFDQVREIIAKLPGTLNHDQMLRLVFIRAVLKEHDEGAVQAADFCLATARSLGGEEGARLKNQAAFYLLSDKHSLRKSDGVKILLGVMKDQRGASLAAARVLARLSLSTDKNEDIPLTPQEVMEVTNLLPLLVGHEPGDALLAADLKIHGDPSSKREAINQLIAGYQNAPRSAQLDFARWLNARGLHDRVISFAGTTRPRNDTDWLLIVLDAKCARGDWSEIPEMLNFPAGFGIPDSVKHLYLARVAMMLGEKSHADEEWQSVNGSLHLEKPETLAYIAAYEQEIGAVEQAMITYREMADRKETHLPGLVGLLRLQPRTTNVDRLIPLYEELLAAAPDFSDAEGDLAYLKLLKNDNVLKNSELAEKLLMAQPNSLARISSAALGRLRSGNTSGALSLYQKNNIDWKTSPDSWKAVYVAVLRASGEVLMADRLADSIGSTSLNQQEKELLVYPVPKSDK